MAVCTRGSRRGECVNRWEMNGDCRRMTNGGRWQSTMVASATIRMTKVKRRTRYSCPEAARDSMPCSAVAAPRMASMHDWKPTDSIGRHQRVMRAGDGSTTLVEAGKLSIVKAVARSKVRFPFGASGSDDSTPVLPLLKITRCSTSQARDRRGLRRWWPMLSRRIRVKVTQ